MSNTATLEQMKPSLESRLQDLLDCEEIRDVITRYALSFEAQDWAMHRACFTGEIEMDFAVSAAIGGGPIRMHVDEWVAGVRAFHETLAGRQHISIVQSIEITGDDAYARSLLHAQHYLPSKQGDPVQRMLGWYGNWLVRTLKGWRVHKMVQHIDWNEGNWGIVEQAVRRIS